MPTYLSILASVLLLGISCCSAIVAQPPAAPVAKPAPPPPPRYIQPGEPRRDVAAQKIRGELLSYDPATRTGTYKKSADGTTASFIALPHVICQHHGATGDMSDYRVGERLRFIVHESQDGQWNLLGLVAEELEEIVAHDEPYFVDKIDAEKGILTCTRRNRAGDKIVWPGMLISTDKETRYWKDGKPDAKFSDLAVGMPLFMKTHGGEGLFTRTAWEVLLDEASVQLFKEEQVAAHLKRLEAEGLPGYVDAVTEKELRLTLFPEAMGFVLNRPSDNKTASTPQRGLRAKQTAQLAIAGLNRVATGDRYSGKITLVRPYIRQGSYICEVTVALDAPLPDTFRPAAVARLWPQAK